MRSAILTATLTLLLSATPLFAQKDGESPWRLGMAWRAASGHQVGPELQRVLSNGSVNTRVDFSVLARVANAKQLAFIPLGPITTGGLRVQWAHSHCQRNWALARTGAAPGTRSQARGLRPSCGMRAHSRLAHLHGAWSILMEPPPLVLSSIWVSAWTSSFSATWPGRSFGSSVIRTASHRWTDSDWRFPIVGKAAFVKECRGHSMTVGCIKGRSRSRLLPFASPTRPKPEPPMV